jgi:hypothetical protein
MEDELIGFARRHRTEAAASLVAVIRDSTATASSRTQAATKLLEYADGRPGQAKAITVADLGSMTDEQRMELLQALLTHYLPEGALQAMLRESVTEAVKLLPAPPTPKFGFRRGTDAPTPKFGRGISASRRNELDNGASRTADSRESQHRDEGALKTIPLAAELPPPRSPAHSPIDPNEPSHFPNGMPIRRIGDGELHANSVDQGRDHWSNLLHGYNAAKWRNGGGNGHGR